MNITEAQATQRLFDERHWEINDDGFHKLRHITLHLAILLGKLGRYCERLEHGESPDTAIVVEEVTPDLLVYGLQLANLFGADLDDLYQRRLTGNRARLTKQ